MKKIFDNISVKTSKLITNSYSTSFSLGIRAFSPKFREPIYSIYGFVRIADEIVDSFHDYDKILLMKKFREDTFDAIKLGISSNPVLNSFQAVVSKYNIDYQLIDKFLKSMEMDLTEKTYERNNYDDYIFGSAEAVGLMCLKVFVGGDKLKYDELKFSAQMLGSAFQKVNFLRDIKSDLDERGRIYLPDVKHSEKISDEDKIRLEKEVENEFDEALKGIMKLPIGVKLGVYSAYLYYRVLFNKIKKMKAQDLLKKRVRVSDFQKLILLLKSVFKIKILKLI
jgi:phytoene/squalene synthetase